ncbi:Trypsin [Cercospora zeina]
MQLKHIIISLTPALVSSAAITKRIVGGEVATLGQFPYLVSLSGVYDDTTELTQFCGGALLNPTTVLTAAHCVEWVLNEPNDFNVRAGSLYYNQSGVTSLVESYVQHPEYKDGNYDFAILKLATPIEESYTISYAQLQEEDVDPAAGEIATVAGWGLDSDGGYRRPELYWVSIPVVGRAECVSDFSGPNITITEQMFCAGTKEGGKGDCDGDSGGPVSIDNLVTGLVSFSLGCASPKYPSVYARVSTAIPFIKAYL